VLCGSVFLAGVLSDGFVRDGIFTKGGKEPSVGCSYFSLQNGQVQGIKTLSFTQLSYKYALV
jgi:hypothetical protein